MDRRAFLATGAAATATLAGCLSSDDGNSDRITELEGELNATEDELADKTERIETLETEAEEYEVKIAAKNDELESLEADLEAERETVTSLEGDLADRREELTTLEDDLATQQSEADSLAADLEAERDAKADLESELATREDTIASLEADIESETDRADDLEADLEAEQARVSELEADLSDREGTIETLETDLEAATEDIEALESQLAAKDDELATLEADLSDKEAEIETLEAEIADLEPGHDFTDAEIDQAVAVAEDTREAVVEILTTSGSGTGFQIDSGAFVTADHIFGTFSLYGPYVDVWRDDDLRAIETAETNSDLDLRAVETDESGAGDSIDIRDGADLEAGDVVVTVGHPFNVGRWVISVGRYLETATTSNGERDILELPTNSGSSGSPVFNLDGQFVGMHRAAVASRDAEEKPDDPFTSFDGYEPDAVLVPAGQIVDQLIDWGY